MKIVWYVEEHELLLRDLLEMLQIRYGVKCGIGDCGVTNENALNLRREPLRQVGIVVQYVAAREEIVSKCIGMEDIGAEGIWKWQDGNVTYSFDVSPRRMNFLFGNVSRILSRNHRRTWSVCFQFEKFNGLAS